MNELSSVAVVFRYLLSSSETAFKKKTKNKILNLILWDDTYHFEH